MSRNPHAASLRAHKPKRIEDKRQLARESVAYEDMTEAEREIYARWANGPDEGD